MKLMLFAAALALVPTTAAAQSMNAEQFNRRAALAVGQQPRFCPPKGEFSMDDKQFMAGLSAIPAADRARIDMTEAVTRIFVSRFPCR